VKTRAAVLAAFAVLLVLTPLDMAGTDSELATADAVPGGADRGGMPAGDMPAPVANPAMTAG